MNVLALPSGASIDTRELPAESNTVISIERTEYFCQHEYKLCHILKTSIEGVFRPYREALRVPFSTSSDDLVVLDDSNASVKCDNSCQLSDILNRSIDLKKFSRVIFYGDNESPSFDLFLLYVYPHPAFTFRDNAIIDVSSESVKLLSYRYSMSSLSQNRSKIGCLIDSNMGINAKIMNHLYFLGSRFGYKVYPIAVGKIEDYKLGNFPGIDIFVNLQCQFCFQLRQKFSIPVLNYFEFVSGILECFWDYPYGDYMSLLLREQSELIENARISGFIENCESDFSTEFAAPQNISPNTSCTIEQGLFGTPKTYNSLL